MTLSFVVIYLLRNKAKSDAMISGVLWGDVCELLDGGVRVCGSAIIKT